MVFRSLQPFYTRFTCHHVGMTGGNKRSINDAKPFAVCAKIATFPKHCIYSSRYIWYMYAILSRDAVVCYFVSTKLPARFNGQI